MSTLPNALTPTAVRAVRVLPAEDPYKKLWWVALAGFIFTALWLCFPMMDHSIGSTTISLPKPALDATSAEQSLDSSINPSGAPGAAITAKDEKKEEEPASRLYQATPDGAGATGQPVASSSLAQELKDTGKVNAGGWSERAQSGFSSPHLTSSLSGVGSAKGGSTASSGSNAFGLGNGAATVSQTLGLENAAQNAAANTASMRALKGAGAASNLTPTLHGNAEAAAAGASRSFDGARGNNGGINAANAKGSGVGAYADLSAAAANLKANDPKLDKKDMGTPPAVNLPQSSGGNQFAQQMAMIVVTSVIAGAVGGPAGAMMTSMATMVIQNQQAKAAEQRQQSGLSRAQGQQGK